MNLPGKHPLILLQDIEKRSKAHAFELPQQLDARITWDGVGFRIGNRHLLAAVDEIKEIMPLPRLVPVFGAKRWVKGIANIRGSLLPIMDLRDFIHGEPSILDRHSRVLVMQQNGLVAGLLVDEVLGLRYFYEEEFDVGVTGEEFGLTAYLCGSYRHERETWPIFSMKQLAASPEFMQVSI